MHKYLLELQQLVAELRDKEQGCPWILVQTFESLASLTIEESYELADSIEREENKAILDELSDVLLHIMLYAQLGTELNEFNLETIAKKAIEKQLRRKPIFHAHAAKSAEEALKQWEDNKSKEKAQQPNKSALDNIPRSLPSMLRALKLQKHAATQGFDWKHSEQFFSKIQEEIAELLAEIKQPENHDKMTEELGDVLFAVISLARHFNVDPEYALLKSNNKFEQRFRKLEAKFQNNGELIKNSSLPAILAVWTQIKEDE